MSEQTPRDWADEAATHMLRPDSNLGQRLRAHLATPLLEDLQQAIAAELKAAMRHALQVAEQCRKELS